MPPAPRELEYDLFVSYAPADNEEGKVSALVRAIAQRYENEYRAELRIFFDESRLEESPTRSDAKLRAVDRSPVFLAVLSPRYFDCSSCHRECERHLECCLENCLSDAAAVAVVVGEQSAPELFESRPPADGSLERLEFVPSIDCRTWWCECQSSKEPPESSDTIGKLVAAINDRLTQIPDRLTPVAADESTDVFEAACEKKDAEEDAEVDAAEPVLDRPTACSGPSESEEPASNANEPIEITENVQFTVFRPRAVPPSQWRTMLAFAHLSELPPDAAPDEPDPVKVVEELAKTALGADFQEYGKTTQDSTSAIPRQRQILFIPTVEGVEFNPPRCEFLWVENVHKTEFRLRASPQLDGKTARGRLTVFLGCLIIADIPLQFRVDSKAVAADSKSAESASASPYRNIFASHSHHDVAIVRHFEGHAKAFGDRYFIDVADLRSGQMWNDQLMRLIEQADVFQLFWSHNAMRSQFVRQEWEYAISLRRPDFVRPIYWETPLPEDPTTGLPPQHLRQLHFQFIGSPPPNEVILRSEVEETPPPAVPPSRPIGPRPAAPAASVSADAKEGPLWDALGTPAWKSPPGRSATETFGPRTQDRSPTAPGRRSRSAMWLGAATAFVILAAAGLWSFNGGGRTPTPTTGLAQQGGPPPSTISGLAPTGPPPTPPAVPSTGPRATGSIVKNDTPPLPNQPEELRAAPTSAGRPDVPPPLFEVSLQDCRDKGSRALKEGNLAEARFWFEQGLNIAQRRAEAKPDDSAASAYSDGSSRYVTGAPKWPERAVESAFEAVVKRDLSGALESMADLSIREGKLEEARGYLRRDFEIWKGPTFNATTDAKQRLSQALEQGDGFLRQGATDLARRSFQRYLETAGQFASSPHSDPAKKAGAPVPPGP